MNTLLIPFAFNRIGHPSRVTEARLDLMVQEAAQISGSKLCVLTSGYTRESPCNPTESVERPLCSEMHAYLLKRHAAFAESCTVTGGPYGWGTLSEIVQAVRVAQNRFCGCFGKKAAVYLFSSVDHLPRIRKYCWFVLPRGWQPRYIPVEHRLNEPAKEQAKFIKDLPLLLSIGMLRLVSGD